MKKIIILIVLLLIILTGCASTHTHENGAPIYFLEPDGYIIASIDIEGYKFLYGYILEDDYQSYLHGELDGVLVVRHPYKNGRETSVSTKEIIYITVGVYKDYRPWL